MAYNIAIDGPAGAGKGTVAKIIANEKKFLYIDTGSLYRSITVYMLENNVDITNQIEVEKNIDKVDIKLVYIGEEQKVILNGEDVTGRIRTEQVSSATSIVAAIPKVREKLVELQRKLAGENNVVMEGRDISSVVLPNANLKIYLDSTVDERAKRRYLEQTSKGEEVVLEEIKKDIIERDNRDMNREMSPLIKVEDAIYIDASEITAQEAAEKIISLIK